MGTFFETQCIYLSIYLSIYVCLQIFAATNDCIGRITVSLSLLFVRCCRAVVCVSQTVDGWPRSNTHAGVAPRMLSHIPVFSRDQRNLAKCDYTLSVSTNTVPSD